MTQPNSSIFKEYRETFWEKAKESSFEQFCDAALKTRNNNIGAVADQLFEGRSQAAKDNNIEIMRKMPLALTSYGPQTDAEFEIRAEEHVLRFSNRRSSIGELRGDVLRQQLGEIRAKSPELSLFNAVEVIAQNPETAGWPYFRAFIGSVSIRCGDIDEGDTSIVLEDVKLLYAVYLAFIVDAEACGIKEGKWKGLFAMIWPQLIEEIKQYPSYQPELTNWKSGLQRNLNIKLQEMRLKFAAEDLSKSLVQKNHLLNIKVRDLLQKIKVVEKSFPKDRAILIKVLHATTALIESETTSLDSSAKHEFLERYGKLIQEISQQKDWGKAIASAMLAIIGACIVGLCVACGFGVIGLPVLAWGLSYLVGAGALSGLVSLVGLSFFAREVKHNQAIQEVAEACENVKDAVSAQSRQAAPL